MVGSSANQSDRIELTVDGTLLVDDLVRQINEQQKQTGVQLDGTPLELLSKVNFDEVVQDSLNDTSIPAEAASTNEPVESSEVSVQLFDELYTPQHSSVWNGPAHPTTLREGLRAVVDNNNHDNQAKFGDVVMNRTVNPSYDFLEGLNAYASVGTQLSLGGISVRYQFFVLSFWNALCIFQFCFLIFAYSSPLLCLFASFSLHSAMLTALRLSGRDPPPTKPRCRLILLRYTPDR